MSEANQSSGGATHTPGGTTENPDQTSTTKTEDTVSYDTYRKTVDENKSLKGRLKSFEEKELKEREKSGQFETLYREANERLQALEQQNKQTIANFAYSSIESQFEAEAIKAGCQRIEALKKLVDLKELAPAVDEKFRVKPDALKSLIEKSQKEYDFLFSKPAPTVKDGGPASSSSSTLTYDAWLKLPIEEKKKRVSEVMAASDKK